MDYLSQFRKPGGWVGTVYDEDLSDASATPVQSASQQPFHAMPSKAKLLPVVVIPRIDNPQEYTLPPCDDFVAKVLEETTTLDGTHYKLEFRDGRQENVSSDDLLSFENAKSALTRFKNPEESSSEEASTQEDNDSDDILTLQKDLYLTADESEPDSDAGPILRRNNTQRRSARNGASYSRSSLDKNRSNDSDLADGSDSGRRKRQRITRTTSSGANRSSPRNSARDSELIHLVDEDESSSSDGDPSLLHSDVLPRTRKRKRMTARQADTEKRDGIRFGKSRKAGTRQSARSTRAQGMIEESGIGDIYRFDSESPRRRHKAVGAREAFQPLPSNDKFHLRHCQQCDTCGNWGGGPYGQLVHCQGCTLSYHKHCLGPRTHRDHLVTKVGEANFVLQCRRCIGVAKAKDGTAPEQGMCQHCREIGPAARPFRKRKTTTQEEKEREENDGEDPVIYVKPSLLNNPKNVLFRCVSCWRAYHFHHLCSRAEFPSVDDNEDRIADERFKEYDKEFACSDCIQMKEMKKKPSGLVAWRPIDPDFYVIGASVEAIDEDVKEYLVKWENKSHYQCQWMSGAWVWGITPHAMRKAFTKRAEGPTMNIEDAVPEDYLRVDIVLDVRFTSIVEIRAEEIDKARIREVDQALIKFKGLGYEDAAWEKVPTPEDGERWTDFVKAYDDWVMGKYIRCPKVGALRVRLNKILCTDFPTLEKKVQPEKLTGGELMKYQLDGVNWLYYRWWLRTNAVLADEMGLGKTIQIIGFLATMVYDHNCFPFLVIVPNGTVPNWRREIRQWAPALRVVTYHGSSQARSMAHQYELFPNGAKELRCHIVVTSYEAAVDESSRKLLKNIPWQGLIVDEGQRLKSDKTQLYAILSSLKIPFRLLLTGTPVQNNARELFNLLQFLDKGFDAAALDLEYAELTKDNVPQLHELIRPFLLRRTKAQVLKSLPPMAQIVLPVSMSSLQAKVYGSILSKNTDLIKALYDRAKRPTGKGDRANLNNILMQLRKCLCHPFVYSQDIEEKTTETAVSHRNLVEASAKLPLLEVLLPKLKQRGHRVLIFSQFLTMLNIMEDFMDGLGLRYERLDGTLSSMVKQKRIDAFNAPDSPLFAFLLSTRAGGIGINLATADTVIILDPDFNPHQDIQALSRAHRIGQKNKVLCFQLMTRASAEEKIVQIGRRKMALDHVLIEKMDNDDDSGVDVESILRFGAADILEGKTQEIRYDAASIEKLLDRSQFEETKVSEENTAESQFSYARVWANDAESLADSLGSDNERETAPDPGVWDRILKERERQVAVEAAARQDMLGRGRRVRHNVDYSLADQRNASLSKHPRRRGSGSDSDTDFRADDKKSDAEESDGADEAIDNLELAEVSSSREPLLSYSPMQQTNRPETATFRSSGAESMARPLHPPATVTTSQPSQQTFQRATVCWPGPGDAPAGDDNELTYQCYVCGTFHRLGYCPLKLAGPEYCNLCGLAHFGVARSCPHIKSETQVREMLQALRSSPESGHLIELAKKYLTGVKGTLVQEKKKKSEKVAFEAALKNSQQIYGMSPSQ